ncbi:MAG: hypothetical protein ACLP0J_15135 [Solirubrobacteraceae bacterium]
MAYEAIELDAGSDPNALDLVLEQLTETGLVQGTPSTTTVAPVAGDYVVRLPW